MRTELARILGVDALPKNLKVLRGGVLRLGDGYRIWKTIDQKTLRLISSQSNLFYELNRRGEPICVCLCGPKDLKSRGSKRR